MKVVISFKVDKGIREALRKLAQEENRSLSNYILTLLLDHLKTRGVDWREKGSE